MGKKSFYEIEKENQVRDALLIKVNLKKKILKNFRDALKKERKRKENDDR